MSVKSKIASITGNDEDEAPPSALRSPEDQAAYDVYMAKQGKLFELFHKMVDKLPWFTEEEQREAHAHINAVDPNTAHLLPGPVAEPIEPPPPPTAEELAAIDDTGGSSTHAASSDSTEASPVEAAAPADPDGPHEV